MLDTVIAIICIVVGGLFISGSRKEALESSKAYFSHLMKQQYLPFAFFEATSKPMLIGIVYKVLGTAMIVGGVALLLRG